MKREKSCGAVLFRREDGGAVYLVLHSTLGHWTLCKGHMESGETEHETAEREIREETGLTARFVEGFRQVITYSPAPGVIKDVVFFLAQAGPGAAVCQPEEVAEIRFVPYEQALALLTHTSDRETLKRARQALEAQKQTGADRRKAEDRDAHASV